MKRNYILLLFIFVFCGSNINAQTNPMLESVKSVGKNVDSLIPFTATEDTTLASSQSAPSGPGDRFIYWIHGLGGNQSSWIMASTATAQGVSKNGQVIFPRRQAECISDIKYDESVSSFGAAEHSLQEIIHGKRQGISQTTRLGDFLIAHSQGGLVSRYLDKDLNTGNPANYYRDFGGIVTFGTPHGGAAIINTAQNDINPPIAKFFEDACNAMTAGPLAEGVGDSWIVKLFKLQKKAAEFRQEMCENAGVFGNTFARMYTGKLGVEYRTTSTTISALKAYTTPTPSACFYGVKAKEGLAFDILYSYTMQGANNYPHFEAYKSTSEAKQEANDMMNKYKNKAESLYPYWKCKMKWFPIPGMSCNWVGNYGWYRLYMDGVTFLKNADDRWQDIIGARTVTYETVTTVYCVDPGDPIGNDATSNSPYLSKKYKVSDDTTAETPTNPCAEWPGTVPVYHTVTVPVVSYKESDGIVLAESASAFTNSPYIRPLFGSNHEQMKNDDNTRKALMDVYDGKRGSYFLTPPR